MASAWEGAARGLESGFRLGMDMHERQRQADRQERGDERQAGLDARSEARQGLQDQRQAAQDQRQAHNDQLAMLDRRKKDLGTRAAVYTDATDPATLDAFANEVEVIRDEESALTARISNPGAPAPQDGDAGPAQTVKKLVRNARVPAHFFVRKDGKPSVIDQVVQAQMGDDPEAKIKGWNALLHQDLQSGVGQDSPHGGKIIRKDIDSLVPDPNDPERVIPTLKVWIKGDDSGDGIRSRRAGALGPDAPAGATGFYLAPMTEGRSSDAKADDKVRSVSIKDSMARLDALMQAAELINTTTEGQQGFAQFMATGGADPVARFKAARSAIGLPAEPKTKTTRTGIPAGGLYEETTDSQGRVTSSRTIPSAAAPKPTGLQATLDAIEGMDISEADKAALSKAAAQAKGPRGGRGLAAGPDGGPSLKDREQTRKEAKDRFDRADKNADNAEKAVDTVRATLRDLNAKLNSWNYDPKGPEAKADATRRTELEAEIRTKAKLAETARTRASSLSKDLDEPPAAARRFDKTGKDITPKVIKFDKSGKRVGD